MIARLISVVHRRRSLALAACTVVTTTLACAGHDSSASADSANGAAPTASANTGASASGSQGATTVPVPAQTSSATDSANSSTAKPAPKQAGGDAAGTRVISVAGVDLTGVGYDRGNPRAPVVLVELSDFGCPYCGQFARETYPAIEREYISTGKVFFKSVQFVMGSFPNGTQASRAAECAADQRQFWPMSARLYGTQSDWRGMALPEPVFVHDAAAAGLDTTRFAACYGTGDMHPRSQLATAAANQLGIRATPSFLVNGRLVEGALPLDAFRSVLNDAIAENSRGNK